MALKIVGSSPIIHPIKKDRCKCIGLSLWGGLGLERALRKHAGGMFLARGRVPGFPNAVRKDRGREAEVRRRRLSWVLLSLWNGTGLERRIRKQSGGLFSRRGRVPWLPERGPQGPWAGRRRSSQKVRMISGGYSPPYPAILPGNLLQDMGFRQLFLLVYAMLLASWQGAGES